jgi:hypothetical protein
MTAPCWHCGLAPGPSSECLLRLLAELADAHVLDHAATQRAGFYGTGGHGRLGLEFGVLDPSTLKPASRPVTSHGAQLGPCTLPNPLLLAQRVPARVGSFCDPDRKSSGRICVAAGGARATGRPAAGTVLQARLSRCGEHHTAGDRCSADRRDRPHSHSAEVFW